MKTLTIFITPGGRSSPRRTFSTLSSKRASSAPFCRSYCLFSDSMSFASDSSSNANCQYWPRDNVANKSSSIVEPALTPLGPLTAFLPMIIAFRRAYVLRSKMPTSSSRSRAKRSTSSRSICNARSSFSIPWRLKTRTSTTVP